jgi:asparagine synthase (glutamine-hydrolysing)
VAAGRERRVMSAITALLALDGEPLDPAAIVSISSSMAHRGPDDLNVWHERAVALGHASLRVVPRDCQRQPLRHPASGSAIAFDGRLDARSDLAARCGIDQSELTELSDAALLLRAYLARGAPILAEVLGDFAFALWDGAQARLLCARDVLGLRPLFYRAGDRELIVASELQAVLRGRAATPNSGMVAEVLANAITSRDETLFAGVYRVPPGHALSAERGQWRVVQFARLEAPPPIHYADEHEYFDHFRAVFTAALRDRLPIKGKAAVMLSGGVDSTTMYAAARQLAEVDAYTVGYDDPELDETAIARMVVEQNGGRHHRVDVSAATYDYIEEIDRYRDLPTNPSGANSARLRRQAKRDGVSVLLSGVGGDECFLGHSGRWADWLCAGEWSLLWRELHTWHVSYDRVPWSVLARSTLHPLLPESARRLASTLGRGRAFSWLPESFVRETNLLDRARRTPPQVGPTYAITGMMRAMVSGEAVAAWEEQNRLAARFQQDERMPYLDRRVIAFALGMPETLRSRPGAPKYFARQSWGAHLPAAVINPLDARDYTQQVVDVLETLGGARRFDRLAITDAGWVDRDAVRRMSAELFSTARTSRRFIGHAWKLWSILSVDEWYQRALHARSSPVPIATTAAFGLD